jgi:hypothetical protein
MKSTVYWMVKQSQVLVLAVSPVLKGQAFWNLMLRHAVRVVSDFSNGPSAISFMFKMACFYRPNI